MKYKQAKGAWFGKLTNRDTLDVLPAAMIKKGFFKINSSYVYYRYNTLQ